MADIRVLIVDDSAFARLAISRELKSAEGISVIDYARDGLEAIEKIRLLKPDVVTLDIEMPRMDGLTTLEKVMCECPTPVVMLSSLTGNGTEATIRALELGAVDFFLKHTLANPVGDEGDANGLRNKIIMASKTSLRALSWPGTRITERKPASNSMPLDIPGKAAATAQPATRVIVIGSSTGGPKALYQVVPSIPADIPAAILIVQHMPPGFTNSLANRLSQLSNIAVKEASSGDMLYNGTAFIAKGGYHMVVEKDGTLSLNQNPPVCSVRPSVDVTMESAVRVFGSSILGVVLTGMGSDGTQGARQIKMMGGRVIVEDESTCVVFGMPKSVLESGSADRVVPLPKITEAIVEETRSQIRGEKNDRSGIPIPEKQNI